MDIKQAIEQCKVMRIRTVAKSDAIYDSKREASDAESAMSKAKNPKDFEKNKKECLAGVAAGEKAVKPWENEIKAWENAIANLEKEIKAGEDEIAQKVKEIDAVNKLIDEANAKIKAYNDDLILGERDPRAKPYIERNDGIAKLKSTTIFLVAAMTLAKSERETLKNQQEWVAKPINELKEIKDRASKAKFKPPK